MTHVFPFIPGWVCSSLIDFYMEVAEKFPDGAHMVEVGCWLGKSASILGVELANQGKWNTRIDLVDVWDGGEDEGLAKAAAQQDLFTNCWKNLCNAGLRKFFRPINLPSVRASRAYDDRSLQFVFVDAHHSYESVKADILAWWPKIAPGGLLSGHDFDSGTDEGVCKAVDELYPHRILKGRCWLVEK